MGEAPDVPPKGETSVPVPATAETEAPGAPISGLIKVVFSCCGPRDELLTIDPTRSITLQGSGIGLADHEARDGKRPTPSQEAVEWFAHIYQTDDASLSAAPLNIEDLDAEVTGSSVHEDDLSGQRSRRKRLVCWIGAVGIGTD